MKKILSLFILCTLIFASGCGKYEVRYGRLVEVHDKDDANLFNKFGSTLDAMFPGGYTATVEMEEEVYLEDRGYIGDIYRKFVWYIEYKDGNNETRTLKIYNDVDYGGSYYFDKGYKGSVDFGSAVMDHITKEYVNKYYDEYFFDAYLGEYDTTGSYDGYSYFNFYPPSDPDEPYDRDAEHARYMEQLEKSDKYKGKISTPEGAINLSKLTPANVFEMCPVEVGQQIKLRITSGMDEEIFAENADKQLSDMAEAMNEFFGNNMSAYFRVYLDRSDDKYIWDIFKEYTVVYEKGEKGELIDYGSFSERE